MDRIGAHAGCSGRWGAWGWWGSGRPSPCQDLTVDPARDESGGGPESLPGQKAKALLKQSFHKYLLSTYYRLAGATVVNVSAKTIILTATM